MADHRYFSRGSTGHRFYGFADHAIRSIVLDVQHIAQQPENLRRTWPYVLSPLESLCEVLIHEACHLATGRTRITGLLRRALRSPTVLKAAELRIMRMIPRGRV